MHEYCFTNGVLLLSRVWGNYFNLSSDKHILWHWILHFAKKLKVECRFSTGNFWFQASCGMWKRVLQYSPIPWSGTNDCSLCDLLCSTLWPSKKSSNLSFLWENWVTCKLATGRFGGYCWEELLHTDDLRRFWVVRMPSTSPNQRTSRFTATARIKRAKQLQSRATRVAHQG
jgi:hypothetical protein